MFFTDLQVRSVCEIAMHDRAGERTFDARHVSKRIGPCDLLLSLNPWQSPSLDRLVQILTPSLSVGFSPAFDVALPKPLTLHAADLAFSVPARLSPSLCLDDFSAPPRLPPRVTKRVRDFLKAAVPGKRILVVHNETKAEKIWPPHLLEDLLAAFLARHPGFVAFLVDFKKPQLNLKTFRGRVTHSKGLPLIYALEVVHQSDLFLGVDSCMLHAADLFRIPGVGLFGPTDPLRWGFRFAQHRHIHDPRGMKFIRVDSVLDSLESLLK